MVNRPPPDTHTKPFNFIQLKGFFFGKSVICCSTAFREEHWHTRRHRGNITGHKVHFSLMTGARVPKDACVDRYPMPQREMSARQKAGALDR